MHFNINIILICCTWISVNAWDSEELEIFDLVEAINKNFYEVMGISENASHTEVKRAFRGLSIVLHPDKSDAPDANVQFRNLVAIYDVLKDAGKREKYNKVLKEGLPNWKSALYYYRRMRKIGLYEFFLLLFIIISIGQYLFGWAAYLEKKYTAKEIIGSKLKKMQKKGKTIDVDTLLNEIPKPSILHTLPFQIPLAIWNLPSNIKEGFRRANELKEIALEKRRLELEAEKFQKELEEQAEQQARLRKENKENLRKRKQNAKAPEKSEAELKGYSQIKARELTEDDLVRPATQKVAQLNGGFWTDEDLTELIRLVKKYPSGSSSRWNTIAEAMNRTVQEVTFMAAKMKENGYRLPGQAASDSVAENIVQETQESVKKEKVKKTADNNIVIPETNWSQEQQRALESAIVKYRKTAGGDRWQKIANCVPEKTKEECLVRYKYLCELVKTQKKAEEELEQQKEVEAEQETPATTVEESEVTKVDSVDETETTTTVKKRNKRKERRRRRDLSSGEDSDDAYQYELN